MCKIMTQKHIPLLKIMISLSILYLNTMCIAISWQLKTTFLFFQADVCHAYQVLKKHGIKDERIVVMMYDDIAENEEWVFPLSIFTSSSTYFDKKTKRDEHLEQTWNFSSHDTCGSGRHMIHCNFLLVYLSFPYSICLIGKPKPPYVGI